MFARQSAACPFCFSEEMRVSLHAGDMPEPGGGGTHVGLAIVCRRCGKTLFDVRSSRGSDAISATGVSVCERCEEGLRARHNGWREEDIPQAVHEPGTRACPKCGSPLRPVWWRGWNYHI